MGDAPQLEKIVLKVIPDAQSRVLALQSGAVDISGGEAGTIPFDNLELLRADPQLSVQQAAGTSSHFLIFNENQWMLQDVNVRRAINLTIDKQSIVEQLLGGAGQEAQGLFPLTVPYITERNNRWYGHDLDEARRLLREAGYTDSDGDGALEGRPQAGAEARAAAGRVSRVEADSRSGSVPIASSGHTSSASGA